MNDKPPGTRPYEMIAYAALVAVFFMQMSEEFPLGGLLVFGCGVLAMVGRLKLGPVFYLLLVAGNQLLQHDLQHFQGIGPRDFFAPAWLDFRDVVVCMGVLAFVAVHYRLQGIWFHHLAVDPRRRPTPVKVPLKSFRLFLSRFAEIPDPRRRTPDQITREEISRFIVSLPVWVLLAQFMTLGIAQDGLGYGNITRYTNIPPWLNRIILVTWVLGLGTFVVVNLLDIWHRYGMSPTAAWLFLQDTVWRETRGEQRKQQRWLAWNRLRRKTEY